MTRLGKRTFVECAQNVYSLEQSKRVQEKRNADRLLISRVRTGEAVLDEDVQKIQSLHLDEIKQKHGEAAVRKIEDDSIHLFYTNEKRIRRNLEKIAQLSSDTNPIAFIQAKSYGGKSGMGTASHFPTDLPLTTLLARGAKVAIDSRNFCPQWGLYNGTMGTVDEIVFEKGKNPNLGDFPSYVVVDFPLYKGPPWDIDNPTVSQVFCLYCFLANTGKYTQPIFSFIFLFNHTARAYSRYQDVLQSSLRLLL